jgi:hypothetical protein
MAIATFVLASLVSSVLASAVPALDSASASVYLPHLMSAFSEQRHLLFTGGSPRGSTCAI